MENQIHSLSREKLETQLKKYKEIVDMFANSVLGGVARMSLKDMHIINGTEGYYRMTGYTEKESLDPPFSNCGMNLVVPEDMKIIEDALTDMLENDKVIHIDYRIRKKDGSIVWNAAFCTGVQKINDESFIDVFFLDITQDREQRRQNVLNEERFRIISKQTKDIIFEWDIENDQLHYSSVFESIFGSTPPPRTTAELLIGPLFHEEDKPLVEKTIKDLTSAVSYCEFKARLRLADGTYFWALHRITLIKDENSNPTHAIGIVSDVTNFVENAIDLQRQADHDSLTGLLNRTVAKKFIEQILFNSNEQSHHAFVQFDIDLFKQINDFMGHAAGDIVLQNIASQMREMFRNEDVLIRMGGDEFAILLTKFNNLETLKARLNHFLKNISCDFKYEGKIYPLSISIGVAVYPRNGKTFQTLYENADEALYRAKAKGGNCIEYYSKL